MIDLILTLDYEIFGNGAGDVMRDVVYPTSRLLDICDRYGAKMTVMFEVGEYWAFEQYDDQLVKDLGYSPCEAMKKQIIEAVKRDHDLQLHLHPQWIGAKYNHGLWRLQNSFWRLGDLPDGLGSEEQPASIIGALYKGKRTLEELIKPLKGSYECICFRAGGFYAQPSNKIVQAMKKVGLKADSSIVKGYRRTVPFAVDYSNVRIVKSVWWTTETELEKQGTPCENIIELSVSSRMEPYWMNFKPAKLHAALHRRRIERGIPNSFINGNGGNISSVPSFRGVLGKVLSRHAGIFDFCKLSCRNMLHRIQEHVENSDEAVIVIGHSKDFINDCQFDKFLHVLSQRDDVRFTTISEYIRNKIKILNISSALSIAG